MAQFHFSWRTDGERQWARRLGDATELAATAVWLASPAGGYLTGQTIVGGGLAIS